MTKFVSIALLSESETTGCGLRLNGLLLDVHDWSLLGCIGRIGWFFGVLLSWGVSLFGGVAVSEDLITMRKRKHNSNGLRF